MCTGALRVQKTLRLPWNCSYRCLIATLSMLVTEPGSLARDASALNNKAIV